MAKPEAKRNNTFKFITKAYNRLKAIYEAGNKISEGIADTYGEDTQSRINYVMTKDDTAESMNEFITLYRTDPRARKAINEYVFKNNKGVIAKFIASIKEIIEKAVKFVKISQDKVDNFSEQTSDVLIDAMNNVVSLAETWNKTHKNQGKELHAFEKIKDFTAKMEYYRHENTLPVYLHPFGNTETKLNYMLTNSFGKVSDKILSAISSNDFLNEAWDKHAPAEDGFVMLTVNAIRNRFQPGSFIQRLGSYMNLVDGYDTKKMKSYESDALMAQQAANRIHSSINKRLKNAYTRITKDMNQAIHKVTARMFDNGLVHVLDRAGDLEVIIDSRKPHTVIDQMIADILHGFKGKTGNVVIDSAPNGVATITELIAKFYDTRDLGDFANIDMTDVQFANVFSGSEKQAILRLIALNQLKLIDKADLALVRDFKNRSMKVTDNPFKNIVEVSRANAMLNEHIDYGENRVESLTGSHINFEENYIFKSFNTKDASKFKADEGWIILRKADKHTIGVVARIASDFGFVTGLASSVTLNSDGVSISPEVGARMTSSYRRRNNIVRTGLPGHYQYRIMLNNDMLSKLAIDGDVVSSMIRANAHNTEVYNSMSRIAHIIKTERFEVNSQEEAKRFDKMLSKGKGKKYFIQFNHKLLDINDYPNISKHYETAKHATSILGLKHKVNMVNKNVADQVQGYKKESLTKNGTVYHKLESAWRTLITTSAAHIVMANPKKLFVDAQANLSILAANNVPAVAMIKYGKQAFTYGAQMTKLRNALADAEFSMFGKVKGSKEYVAVKKKVDGLRSDVESHPFYPAIAHGFVQSLSTDLLMTDKDRISKVQKQANKIFTWLDSIPGMHWSVMRLSDAIGYPVEYVAEVIQGITESGSQTNDYTDFLIEKIKRIRKDDDAIAVWGEITAIPGQSEIMRLGGMTQLQVDVVSKWILYRSLMDSMNEERKLLGKKDKNFVKTDKEISDIAAKIASESFVNYMTNLPKELDILKDTGVFMFPHFTLRIQKVIASMFVRRTAAAGITMGSAYFTDMMSNSIFGSALPFKNRALLYDRRF